MEAALLALVEFDKVCPKENVSFRIFLQAFYKMLKHLMDS